MDIMAKLINNTFECGYCNIEENYRNTHCKHPKNTGNICPSSNEFPTNCPLQNGYTKEQINGSPVEMSKRLTERRNRKNCITYYAKVCTRNPWTETCKGVNCGHYE